MSKDFYIYQTGDEIRGVWPIDDGIRDRISLRFDEGRRGWAITQPQVEDGAYVEVAFIPVVVFRA